MLAWYRIVASPADLLLHPPLVPPPAAGVTIVHPGAKDPARRWPPARFARVAQRLECDGHTVVVTGSPAERWLAVDVARLAGLPDDRVLAGRTDVGALAALVARARMLVSGDTGIAHLATGYRTPSVLLFGPTPPAWWGPVIDPDLHRVLWHGGRPAGPVPRQAHPALTAVTVDEVLAAVRDVAQRISA
jgi:ADP-heptose:LPS heptosyltransferase